MFILIFLFACIVYGITLPANIDKAKIDEDTSAGGIHIPVVPRQDIIIADSSAGEYTMWTQMQECLAYNPADEYLQFVCRNFALGNALDVWQTDKTFSFTVTDEFAYSAQLGGARYPNSIASLDGQGPHISAPCLVSGAWGLMMGEYESGGWFSSFWDDPVDLSGNVGTHKCIGKQLPNGNILFIGVTGSYDILYQTYSTDLSQQIAYGVVSPGTSYYWGFDINGGIAYVFWYDASLNVYYKTTTDGVNWSSTQTYNLVWPNPYPTNVIGWTQVVVTDAGNPILVFDNWHWDDYNNGLYPYRGKIYVSTDSGANCIEVGNTATDARNFYPTIATGGNYVVVLFGQPRSGTGQYTFWDVYYNYSADNGATWSTPICLTAGITDHINCLWQIAKRLNSTGFPYLFFVFGSSISDPMLDLYANIQSGNPTPSRWYVGLHPSPGIVEKETVAPKRLTLNIAPNPVHNQARITYALPKSGNVSITLYTADGRMVQTIDLGYKSAGFYTRDIDIHKLKNGAYLVLLKINSKVVSGKLIVVH